MQGNLSQISLNDILLLATGGKKSGVLRLNRGKETVEVFSPTVTFFMRRVRSVRERRHCSIR
jgi:hypothetical protein